MIGTKIYKNDLTGYTDAALWCNEHGATITDRGDCYEVTAVPAPTLSEVKTAAIARLKEARDNAEVQPIASGGYTFDYDDKARERISGAIIALDGTDQTLSWTTADDTEATVTASDLKDIVRAVAARSNALHTRYRTQKEAVLKMTDADAIYAYLAEEGLCP